MPRVTYTGADAPQPILDTTTPLAGSATFDTGVILIDGSLTIRGTVFASHTGTIFIEQSYDQNNWDVSTSYSVTAGDGKGFNEQVVADYARIRYVNGSTPQTTFRLRAQIR